MWLLVVAAGSGYLARCLQNSSSFNHSKRPRLIDHSEEEKASSSRSQPISGEYSNVCDEALQVKDRFDRLGGHETSSNFDDDKWKRSPPSCREGVTLTSFQKGVHDVGSKSKSKSKGWPSWPRTQSGCQSKILGDNVIGLKETVPITGTYGESSGLKEETGGGTPSTMDVTVESLLGDVSWIASERDAKSLQVEDLGDLPNILDWTSMAALQKHDMFGPGEGSVASWRTKKTLDRKSRAKSRSRDSSVPATPSLQSVSSSLDMLPIRRKRKAATGSSNFWESSAKEVLLFAMGLHAALVFMRLYSKKELEDSSKQPTTRKMELARTFDDLDDDVSSCTTSAVTAETKTDHMAALEAELAAELEIMQLNMSTGKENQADVETSDVTSSAASLQDDFIEIFDDGSSPPQNQHWAVSPRELDRRLHIVLEQRQAEQIKELEAQLKEAEKKLQMKGVELQSWKNRVQRLSEASLMSPTDMDESPNVHRYASSRANSRRRWFPEELGETQSEDVARVVNALPSLVSAMSSCHISDRGEETDHLERRRRSTRSSFATDRAGPASRSFVTVSDITGRLNEKNGMTGAINSFYTGKPLTNGILLPSADAEVRQTDSHIHEKLVQWNSSKLPCAYQQSQVIRTVETIEERCYHRSRTQASLEREEKWLAKRGKSRHQGVNFLSSRYRSQRPRRRWFS